MNSVCQILKRKKGSYLLAREFNGQHGTNSTFEDCDTEKTMECHYDNDNYSSLSVKEKKCRKNVEEIYDDDNDHCNNEDLEEKFCLSSKDDLLHEFVQWQKSIDGGNRAERQAQEHKRIVMSIV